MSLFSSLYNSIEIIIATLAVIIMVTIGRNQLKKYKQRKLRKYNDRLQWYNNFIKMDLILKHMIDPSEVIQDMKKEGLHPDAQTFNNLISVFIDKGLIDQAKNLMLRWQKQEFAPPLTFQSYEIYFRSLAQIKAEQMPEDKEDIINCIHIVFKNIKDSEQRPYQKLLIDTFLQIGLIEQAIDIFLKQQDQENALLVQLLKSLKNPKLENLELFYAKLYKLFEMARDRKCIKNDEVLLNTLIDLGFKSGDVKKAQSVFQYLQELIPQPNHSTYGIMIKGYGQVRMFDQVMKTYEEMKQRKVGVNEVTLGQLVDACVKCNQLERAEQILEVEQEGQNTIIFTTLLKGLTKYRNIKKALVLFQKMKENPKIQPNTVTYNSLLECAVQSQEYEKMTQIFEECLNNKGQDNQPDLITYSTYIKGLCKAEQIKKALGLFNDIRQSNKFQLDEVIYNSILDGLFKARNLELTEQIYNQMVHDKIKSSNVTYSILIKLYMWQQRYEDAWGVQEVMKQNNVKPGLIVYTCLIQSCIKSKNLDRCLYIYEQMKNYNIPGDTVYYNTLISGLLFNKYIRSALEITMETLD